MLDFEHVDQQIYTRLSSKPYSTLPRLKHTWKTIVENYVTASC